MVKSAPQTNADIPHLLDLIQSEATNLTKFVTKMRGIDWADPASNLLATFVRRQVRSHMPQEK